MRRNRMKLRLFFLAAIILITGCVPSKPVKEAETMPAEVLVKKLEANRRKIKTFKGTGLLMVNSSQAEMKGNFEVVLKKPDSIKISVYGPFGIDLAQVLVTKNEFYFMDVLRNDLYTGRLQQDILKKIMKIELSFDDLMDAFAGAVNLTDKLRREPDSIVPGEETYLLTYNDETNLKKSEYSVNIEDLSIISYRLFNGEQLVFQGDYSEFKDFQDVSIPYVTFIENVDRNENIRIEYREIYVNEEIEELSISIPKDVNRVKW